MRHLRIGRTKKSLLFLLRAEGAGGGNRVSSAPTMEEVWLTQRNWGLTEGATARKQGGWRTGVNILDLFFLLLPSTCCCLSLAKSTQKPGNKRAFWCTGKRTNSAWNRENNDCRYRVEEHQQEQELSVQLPL